MLRSHPYPQNCPGSAAGCYIPPVGRSRVNQPPGLLQTNHCQQDTLQQHKVSGYCFGRQKTARKVSASTHCQHLQGARDKKRASLTHLLFQPFISQRLQERLSALLQRVLFFPWLQGSNLHLCHHIFSSWVSLVLVISDKDTGSHANQ